MKALIASRTSYKTSYAFSYEFPVAEPDKGSRRRYLIPANFSHHETKRGIRVPNSVTGEKEKFIVKYSGADFWHYSLRF